MKNLKDFLKKVLVRIYKEGFPGWIYSSIVFFTALTSWFLAGFSVGKFMELVKDADGFIITMYGIALGGTMANRFIKKKMGIENVQADPPEAAP